MADLIQQTSPLFRLRRGDRQVLVLFPVALPSGRTLADFDSFTLTARSDPDYPRDTPALRAAARTADPAADGWPVVLAAAGTVVGSTVEFPVDGTPLPTGENRCAADVVGEGAATGRVHLLGPVWLSVGGSVR